MGHALVDRVDQPPNSTVISTSAGEFGPSLHALNQAVFDEDGVTLMPVDL